jgi:hypothetical protein
VWTGNENSKPIWNKFIIRKDIIETMQVVLNFCRTVYNILTFTILVGTRYPLNQQSSHGCHTRSRNSLPLYSRVPYAEQELLTLVVNHRVHVAWSLVFCVFLCRLIFVIFSFGHCIVCPSIYDFRLLLWYLQTFLVFIHTVLIEYYGTGGITLDALFNLFRFDVISTEFQWYRPWIAQWSHWGLWKPITVCRGASVFLSLLCRVWGLKFTNDDGFIVLKVGVYLIYY